jgi:hypothetical protein
MEQSTDCKQQEYDSDGLDFLPDDSPLKGKGPAMRKRASQGVTEVQNEIITQEIIEVKDEVQVSRDLILHIRFG